MVIDITTNAASQVVALCDSVVNNDDDVSGIDSDDVPPPLPTTRNEGCAPSSKLHVSIHW